MLIPHSHLVARQFNSWKSWTGLFVKLLSTLPDSSCRGIVELLGWFCRGGAQLLGWSSRGVAKLVGCFHRGVVEVLGWSSCKVVAKVVLSAIVEKNAWQEGIWVSINRSPLFVAIATMYLNCYVQPLSTEIVQNRKGSYRVNSIQEEHRPSICMLQDDNWLPFFALIVHEACFQVYPKPLGVRSSFLLAS